MEARVNWRWSLVRLKGNGIGVVKNRKKRRKVKRRKNPRKNLRKSLRNRRNQKNLKVSRKIENRNLDILARNLGDGMKFQNLKRPVVRRVKQIGGMIVGGVGNEIEVSVIEV
jgi:hypothetical protein